MLHVLVRHKVADFAKWKPVYDAHLPARKTAGLKELHLWHNLENASEVVMLFEAGDIKKVREFFNDADVARTIKKSGVIDTPDIYLLG